MRTLFLSTTVPYPLNTGANHRIFHLLKALAPLGEVTFACPTPGGRWTPELDGVRHLFRQALLFPEESFSAHPSKQPRGPFHRLRRILHHHGHPLEPALVRWYRSPVAAKAIAEACRIPFDLVWVERLISLGLIPADLRSRVIVDLDDIQYRKAAHRLRHTPPTSLLILDILEFLKLRRMERRLVRGRHEYIVCSSLDKAALGGHPRISVVPNGIDIPLHPSWHPSVAHPPLFVFVGAMSTEANADAARFLVHHIHPRIQHRVPDARLILVGANPPPSVLELHDGHSVVVTGTVPSVEPFLRDASVSVVPIRFGGGTRIKILESLAHGVPVVSTRVGAEGLDVEDGRHLLLADSADDFADACIRLSHDPEKCAALSRDGLDLVRTRYDWQVIETAVQRIVTTTT